MEVGVAAAARVASGAGLVEVLVVVVAEARALLMAVHVRVLLADTVLLLLVEKVALAVEVAAVERLGRLGPLHGELSVAHEGLVEVVGVRLTAEIRHLPAAAAVATAGLTEGAAALLTLLEARAAEVVVEVAGRAALLAATALVALALDHLVHGVCVVVILDDVRHVDDDLAAGTESKKTVVGAARAAARGGYSVILP